MKKISLFRCLAIGLVMLVNADCKKVEPTTTDTVVTPPPPPPASQPPSLPPPVVPPPLPPGSVELRVGAGTDHLVFLPTDYCTIFGWVNGYSTSTIEWREISGPTSSLIENPNSLGTKVSGLANGVYEFEIAASENGVTGKDTCSVTVGTMSQNPTEIIFENQHWGAEGLNGSLLWGSAIVINNFHQFIPVGTVFKTYIKRDGTTIWEELIPDFDQSWYGFVSMNGNLAVWSTYDETDSPDIKLVY